MTIKPQHQVYTITIEMNWLLTVHLCVLVQCAPVPPSTEQTAIPDPQDYRGSARAHHLLRRGQLVPQGGGLPF